MFREIIASNGASSSTPHTSSRTSIATGARTLASPSLSIHASMLVREASSALGSQTSLGSGVLTRVLPKKGIVLEIGFGTGEHLLRQDPLV